MEDMEKGGGMRKYRNKGECLQLVNWELNICWLLKKQERKRGQIPLFPHFLRF